eukprot:CAMPEP_0198137466 /NCGR_PEP_ID=MMETSP1443-20131203/942_1 /TAXON_ID=186043 /ORGANISM="Entomoneis sp., Strain CCMP2396" /LENGTH=210 /DNA_ID=CAMNT_0043798895 /DNA_START=152 /DNA_END=784 /DNA_ORIENTATION=+
MVLKSNFVLLLLACISSSALAFLSLQAPTPSSTSLLKAVESKQAEYGKSEEMPNTYVKCGKCQTCFAVAPADLGNGRGRRLGCSVCDHSWFQSLDRVMTLRDGFEMGELPESDKERMELNKKEDRPIGFVGDAKLYVGNISFDCHEDDLKAVFEQAGVVGEISLVRDDEGKIRGFGFVTMRTKEGAKKAMEELHGANVRGRNIAVRESTN